jgi:prepilin-type N-terminal cleavage/methylation domain-containing protein
MKNKNNSHAFTLIETLVAVTILTLAVTGALFSANSALVAANIARDQLTASSLAQEGIEYVRVVRDNAYLAAYGSGSNSSAVGWTNFSTALYPCVANACSLDVNQGLVACQNNACAPLYVANNGLYNEQGVGTKTYFVRTIQASSVSLNEEKIVSTVSWSYHGIPYAVTIIDHLTPWQ